MDALEDAVYEKALTSAASDATARRKIEGVFARLVSVPDAEREGEKLGSGGRPPPVNLPIRVFKRGLLVYLNGVEDEDLDALALSSTAGEQNGAGAESNVVANLNQI